MRKNQTWNRGWGLVFLALVVLWAGSALADETAKLSKNPVPGEKRAEYVIGIGDQIRVMVWKEPDLSQEMAVRIDGRISLPLIGEIQAAGKTINGLTGELEKKYSDFVSDPAVSVMLLQSKSWRYYIIGKVAQPGEFPIDYPITVLQAIARSGGFQDWAKQDKITIVRRRDGHEVLLSFDYEAVVSGKDLRQNINIQPGDTIVVP